MKWDRNRKVGEEVSRWYIDAIDSGFMDKYLSGNLLLDTGSVGYLEGTTTFHENAIGIDLDYPKYDGINLPFSTKSVDGILSSHMLEHVPTENVSAVLRDWLRVLKYDSYIVCTVPSMYLYERKLDLPSNHNGDHKRFYTPSRLLTEIEAALVPNSYRIELLKDNDKGFNYSIPPGQHCDGACEILVVIKKIKKPNWEIK